MAKSNYYIASPHFFKENKQIALILCSLLNEYLIGMTFRNEKLPTKKRTPISINLQVKFNDLNVDGCDKSYLFDTS